MHTGDPEFWTEEELRRWLRMVSSCFRNPCVFTHQGVIGLPVSVVQRGLQPDKKATREELIERVKANLRPGRQ